MGLLGRLSRLFFRAGSVANTTNILLSGDPRRAERHIVRRSATKLTSRAIRRLLR